MGATLRASSILWPGGIVPFRFNPNFTLVDLATSAMKGWEAVTNVRFVQRQSQPNFIEFVNHPSIGDGCNASGVGRGGGRQLVRCSSAPLATMFHEIGHAIGLIHEHQRSDRDEFIQVFRERVRADRRDDYQRRRNTRNGSVYDFVSIMHYGPNTFAIPGEGPTIERRDGAGPIDNSGLPTIDDAGFVDVIYPTLGVVRRSDSTHEGRIRIQALSVTRASGGQLVTAVRDGDGRLRLIQWRVTQKGAVGRPANASIGAGNVSEVDIAGTDRMVTAVRSGSGRLLLIGWRVQGNRLRRLADSGSQAGAATRIRIVSPTPDLFVTACRIREGRLRLITWDVSSTERIRRVADSGRLAGRISAVSLAHVRTDRGGHLVATTVVTASRRLRTIVWRISSLGSRITRVGDSGNSMGEATQPDTVMSPSGHLLVSCRTRSGGRLKLIALAVRRGGRTVQRIADSGALAGRIGSNSLMARPYGALSAVSTAGRTLKLIKWNVANSGVITRAGDSADQAGRIRLVVSQRTTLSDSVASDAPVCTFVKADAGHIFGITWDDQSATGELE